MFLDIQIGLFGAMDGDKTWEHWQKDVNQGLDYLLKKVNQVVIIALSMGALLTLELAAARPDQVKSLILLSPCLHFQTRLARYTPQLSKILKRFPMPKRLKYSSKKYAQYDQGYAWAPTIAFKHYWLRIQHFDSVLEKVHQPVQIIHSKKDKIAAPSGTQHIYDFVPSTNKEIIWLKKSGHELLLDTETDTVIKNIFSSKLI